MTAIGSLNKTTATALYCESHHEKQSQTLILLHGGGLSSKQWQPQVGGLRDFHLLLPDMPEQGKTGGEFELNDATKRIADLIAAQAHGGQAHVVGLSLGGAIVLELLRAYPGRVQTAIVTGTSGKLNRMLGQVMLWQADLGRLFSAKSMVNTSIRMFGIEAYRDLVYEDLLRATAPGLGR
jgi:pimeloyl-ACP methyl ester carboxylesterase